MLDYDELTINKINVKNKPYTRTKTYKEVYEDYNLWYEENKQKMMYVGEKKYTNDFINVLFNMKKNDKLHPGFREFTNFWYEKKIPPIFDEVFEVSNWNYNQVYRVYERFCKENDIPYGMMFLKRFIPELVYLMEKNR